MMNALSFRRSSWYLLGVFILVVVILILVCIIALEGVSFFIAVSSLSFIRLLVGCGGRDGPGLGTTSGFRVCGPGVCGFSG